VWLSGSEHRSCAGARLCSSVAFLKYVTHNLHRIVMLSEAKHLLLYQAYRREADPSLRSG
ncbi:MAG: hypothetical protein ACRD22_05665, partial [Terriglobia bacterium]